MVAQKGQHFDPYIAYQDLIEEVKISVALSDAEQAVNPKPEETRPRWHSLSKQIIHTLPKDPQFANIAVGLDEITPDADVWELSSRELDKLIRQGRPIERPILIRGKPLRSAARYSEFLSALGRFKQVDVQDLSRPSANVVCHKPVDEVLRRVRRGGKSLTGDSGLPLNCLNLEDIAGHQAEVLPKFLKHPRFQLLREISTRLKDRFPGGMPYTRNPGKRDFIEACAEFSIFAQRGAFSGPHCDALVGTWVHNVRGIKAWPIIPSVPEKEVEIYECEGSFWLPPPELIKMLLLEEGDTFIMPSGMSVIHCPLTVTDCYMVGGMFWDETKILDIMYGIWWTARAPIITNESLSRQLPEVLAVLHQMVNADPDRFRGKLEPETFLRQFDALYEMIIAEGSCDCCPTSGSSLCKCHRDYCKCKVWRDNCNDWCKWRSKNKVKREQSLEPCTLSCPGPAKPASPPLTPIERLTHQHDSIPWVTATDVIRTTELPAARHGAVGVVDPALMDFEVEASLPAEAPESEVSAARHASPSRQATPRAAFIKLAKFEAITPHDGTPAPFHPAASSVRSNESRLSTPLSSPPPPHVFESQADATTPPTSLPDDDDDDDDSDSELSSLASTCPSPSKRPLDDVDDDLGEDTIILPQTPKRLRET